MSISKRPLEYQIQSIYCFSFGLPLNFKISLCVPFSSRSWYIGNVTKTIKKRITNNFVGVLRSTVHDRSKLNPRLTSGLVVYTNLSFTVPILILSLQDEQGDAPQTFVVVQLYPKIITSDLIQYFSLINKLWVSVFKKLSVKILLLKSILCLTLLIWTKSSSDPFKDTTS